MWRLLVSKEGGGGGGSEERKLLYMREIRYIGLFFMGKFFVLPLFAQRR